MLRVGNHPDIYFLLCLARSMMTDHDANAVFRWAIRHETLYRYSTAVVFAPHVLRLSPRPEGVRTLARNLYITPNPIDITDFNDDFGNTCTRVRFGPDAAAELKIESRIEVQLFARPAYGQALSLSALPPLPWAVPHFDSLAIYRQTDGSMQVAALAQRLSSEVGGAPLAFFEHLCSTLYSTIDRQIRVEGSAQTPEQTLATGRGACRDLTVLYLAVCRSLGVAGRFVSGYQGPRGVARRQATPARLAGGVRARARLARLGPDAWRACWPRSRGPVRRSGPSRHHADRWRLLLQRAHRHLDPHLLDRIRSALTIQSSCPPETSMR